MFSIHPVHVYCFDAWEVALTIGISGPNSASVRCRIETVDVYRVDGEHVTAWSYRQLPNDTGRTVNQRAVDQDATSLIFDGTGWSFLTAPPAAVAGSKPPYRESTTPLDEVSTISSGAWIELLYHAARWLPH